jgi:hypothetical protein
MLNTIKWIREAFEKEQGDEVESILTRLQYHKQMYRDDKDIVKAIEVIEQWYQAQA